MMGNFVEIVKQAAIEAVNASSPLLFYFGTVVDDNPLKINIEQKMELTEDFLILTNAVKDHDIEMTVEHRTEVTYLNADHSHLGSSEVSTEVAAEATTTLELDSSKPDVTVTGVAETVVTANATSDASVTIYGVNIDLSHNHTYSGRKAFRVHNGLKKGEKVALIRVQGGNKFLVLDRI